MTDYIGLDESYYGNGLMDSTHNDGNAFDMNNNFSSMMAFGQQGNFLGGNDDLNSFFSPGLGGPSKGLLPYNSNNEQDSMRQGRWDSGEALQMFGQQQQQQQNAFPFPNQNAQMPQQLSMGMTSMMAPTWNAPMVTNVNTNMEVPEETPMTPEEIEKPKRGRPRKRKRKDPISEEEKQRKREAFLERNRRAASKCRKRKKESTENIQARASNLDRESRLLTAELMQMRAEHANWLNIAIEHAKSCTGKADLQAYLKAAEARLAAFSSFIMTDRKKGWAEYQESNTFDNDGSSASDSRSPRDTTNPPGSELEYFDSAQYQNNNDTDEDMTDNDKSRAQADMFSSLTNMSRQASQEGGNASHESQPMDRKNSRSSSGTGTENGSNRDSAYASISRTPEDMKQELPDLEIFGNEDRPVMMGNPRLANNQIKSQSSITGSRPVARKLRSSNNVHLDETVFDN